MKWTVHDEAMLTRSTRPANCQYTRRGASPSLVHHTNRILRSSARMAASRASAGRTSSTFGASSDSDDADVAATTFPSKTIARLFAEHFDHNDTRVSATAVEAAAEYLRIFTREAVWRSDRAAKEAAATAEGSVGHRMLEVADLERVAGTLVLDF
ncbi:CENP-S associating centromere protein X-domain-containing protein [Limtongia smithiae]|uniref:CENP-S associating centromere protein X-domain-containing protein n=1 Tax=Limtongia smithiae TaxID=1125753 RepID=UPI0034CD3B90